MAPSEPRMQAPVAAAAARVPHIETLVIADVADALALSDTAGWNQVGDNYECVDQNLTYMFGESGGAFKLETPNSNDFIDDQGSTGSIYEKDMWSPNDNFFASGPANEALGVETTEPAGYGWIISSTETPA